jgi:hypothetical protein
VCLCLLIPRRSLGSQSRGYQEPTPKWYERGNALVEITLRPGNSRSSFQKRFGRASDHYDRAWQRLPHNLIAAKTTLVCTLPQESADDRALPSSPQLDKKKQMRNAKGGKNMENPPPRRPLKSSGSIAKKSSENQRLRGDWALAGPQFVAFWRAPDGSKSPNSPFCIESLPYPSLNHLKTRDCYKRHIRPYNSAG